MSTHVDVSTPDGGTATIFKHHDGTVDYPGTVPPVLDVPVTTPGGTLKKNNLLSDESPTEIYDASSAHPIAPDADKRPSLASSGQKFHTERPPITTRESAKPLFTRAGTNVSALNEAIWSHENEATDSTSSDSSDDEVYHGRRQIHKVGRRRKDPDDAFRRFNVGNEHYKTKGKVSKRDGRLNISVNENGNTGYLAKALGANFVRPFLKGPGPKEHLKDAQRDLKTKSSDLSIASTVTGPPRPKLNIVVMVIGSRGDIQPFLKVGKLLKEEHGHRVRIATHPAFKDFVENDTGLEFFSVGGDPAELMAFMVKNPGMIPKMDTIKAGEIGRRRDQMAEMFDGFWRACINSTDEEPNKANRGMMKDTAPFVADAIIANPPSFAHIHCAERLGIPLHLMFTFPYTPTQAFPHPLANIKKTNVDPAYSNFMSYPLVEMMTWQGLGDLVNAFRVNTLGLEPVSTLWAPGQLYRLKVPYTYMWSPGLVPKPEDWGPEIDIAGFVFLELASSFEPPEDLVKFLDDGEPPIYIGFGSIVVDDPDKFTKMIFEAVKKAGVRALVSKGWGGLGDDNVPDNIYMLENTPHDWLFPKVKAVIHHGGAGTTAIGLKCGKPSMIVPFFGDQQFWGSMIGSAGAGPEAVPYKELTMEKLADGIKELMTDKCKEEAEKIAKSIEDEGDGAKNAVKSFHRSLTMRGEHSMRCAFIEDQVAVWYLKGTTLRLSAMAAALLVQQKKLTYKQLRLIRHYEWNDFEGPGEPISGGATAIMGTLTSMATGVGSIPFKVTKNQKKRKQHEEKKRRKSGQSERRGSEKNVNTNKSSSNDKESVEADKINENKAPAKDGDKATSGHDMGKHTSEGKPAKMKNGSGEAKDDSKKDDDAESVLSADPEYNDAEQVGMDVAGGFVKTGGALASAPMNLTLAIAQGFHNAPRLYGDTTVRRPRRITGYKSGFKAAGEEAMYGVYDGVTGLVTQPYRQTRDEGAIGLVKGVGMGLGGFVLKDLAAIFGFIGFPLKGVHKELLKHQQPTHFIRKARMTQGNLDIEHDSKEDLAKHTELVQHGWSVAQQVWTMMDEKRKEGLRGKMQVMRERKRWRANGAFENVEMAEKALNAARNGDDLEAIFEKQRMELKAHNERPRKSAMDGVRDRNGQPMKSTGDGQDETEMREHSGAAM